MSAAAAKVAIAAPIRNALAAVAIIGVAAAAGAAVLEPQRMWANWLVVSYCVLTLALGALCFLAVHDAAGATWGVALRRVPEAMAALLPFAAIAVGIVFIARPQLYPWAADSGSLTEGPAAFRDSWLDMPFFLARAAAYAAIWSGFAWTLGRRRATRDGRLAGVFLAAFAVTFSLASFDWIMSLEPGWYSTIFGVYQFAGLFLATLAGVSLIVLWLERSGPLAGVLHEGHLHDLGKLLFAFSTFWAYIWFSQFMLIWYANIPEETTYFITRTSRNWYALFVLNVVLNWIVPFAVLLRRDTKRNRRALGAVCVVVLLGRWLDVWLMIMPAAVEDPPIVGLAEAGTVALATSAFILAVVRALQSKPIVPAEDPALPASLEYESYP